MSYIEVVHLLGHSEEQSQIHSRLRSRAENSLGLPARMSGRYYQRADN